MNSLASECPSAGAVLVRVRIIAAIAAFRAVSRVRARRGMNFVNFRGLPAKEHPPAAAGSRVKPTRERIAMAESKKQDAIALLKDDHGAVQKLFKDFESAKGD